jgi:hypothetical protein
LLIRVARIPDPRLAHEIKAPLMHRRSPFPLDVGPEEDGRAKYTLERGD